MALIRSTHAQNAAHDAIVLDLGDLREQAAKLRARAEADARRIVDEARRKADQMTADAEQRGHQQGFAKGQAEGLAAGRKQGHDEALKQTTEAVSQLQAAWIAAAQTWDAQRRQMLVEARQSLLELAVKMAAKIVHRVPIADPSVVVDQVAAAIEHVARPCDVTVRINPEDRPLLSEAMPQLVGQFASAQHVKLDDDASIARGGCFVTYGKGRIDATLDTQLDRLVEALLPQGAATANDVRETAES